MCFTIPRTYAFYLVYFLPCDDLLLILHRDRHHHHRRRRRRCFFISKGKQTHQPKKITKYQHTRNRKKERISVFFSCNLHEVHILCQAWRTITCYRDFYSNFFPLSHWGATDYKQYNNFRKMRIIDDFMHLLYFIFSLSLFSARKHDAISITCFVINSILIFVFVEFQSY